MNIAIQCRKYLHIARAIAYLAATTVTSTLAQAAPDAPPISVARKAGQTHLANSPDSTAISEAQPKTIALPQILTPQLAAQSLPPPTANPLFNPGTELRGEALVARLQKGGYVLYMRHAVSTVGSDGALTTVPDWWFKCDVQRNISDAGRLQARKVGGAIRLLNIPIAEIKTSQFCRARDTAHELGLGPIEITEDLNHVVGQRVGFDVNIARYGHLLRVPDQGTNTLLVSHTHGSPKAEERAMGSIGEAEIIAYRPDGKGATEPIGKIAVSEWEVLLPKVSTTPASPPTKIVIKEDGK
jgi:phosphohistidine phosphatase SixA